jgi:hypothetical protein
MDEASDALNHVFGSAVPDDEDMAAIEARLARIEVTGERLPPAVLKLSDR